MKTKINLLILSLLLSATGAVAQSESADSTKLLLDRPFSHNWFVSIGGGAQMYFGDYDKQMSFGDRLTPALDIAVGKWFTPDIGFRLMYSGMEYKGLTLDGSHSTGTLYKTMGKMNLYDQKIKYFHFQGDVMFNLSNILFGYNPTRFYNASPYVGLGWMVAYQHPQSREVSATIGLLNSFRLNSAFDLNLDIHGDYVNDRFDGEIVGRSGEGGLTAAVGITYKFPVRGWERSRSGKYSDADFNKMNESINAMQRENSQLKDQLAANNTANSGSTRMETNTIIKTVVAPMLVIFKINTSTLSDDARVNIGFFAEEIKKKSECIYVITGYADSGTGSITRNEALSKARAQAVYDCLTKEYGVPASQLKTDYKGGVNNMYYNDPTLSRATIIKGE
jgi:outer membrane protein OmpA-like peptidoglycan-associated protein